MREARFIHAVALLPQVGLRGLRPCTALHFTEQTEGFFPPFHDAQVSWSVVGAATLTEGSDVRLQWCSQSLLLAPGFSRMKKSSALSAGSCPAVSHRHVAVSIGSAACITVKTFTVGSPSTAGELQIKPCPGLPLLDIIKRYWQRRSCSAQITRAARAASLTHEHAIALPYSTNSDHCCSCRSGAGASPPAAASCLQVTQRPVPHGGCVCAKS